MKNKTTSIALSLLFLILAPVIVFLLYELNTTDENEKLLQSSYRSQLSTIIYSVNQFSLDIAYSWGREMENYYQAKSGAKAAPRFTGLYSCVKGVLTVDSTLDKENIIYSSALPVSRDIAFVSQMSEAAKVRVRKLLNYQKSGYQKVEAWGHPKNDSLFYYILPVNPVDETPKIVIIVLDRKQYIRQVLRPQLDRTAGSFFIFEIFNETTQQSLYATSPVAIKDLENVEKLWLLPDCKMGIKLRTGAVSEFVGKRTVTVLVIFGSLLVLVCLGGFFAIRSVRKELMVAQMKADFVANISHEFRTPLSLISMFAETLELGRARTEEKKNEYYAIIYGEAQRLSKLVNSILNFSHMESGKRAFHFKEFSLQDLVNDIIRAYQFHAQQKGFTFTVQLPETPLMVNADYDALSESVINLIDNGMKYSTDVKKITISAGVKQSFVFIAVEDAGIGIAAGEKKKIFEKFYRVSTGNVHTVKGSGIGLSIVDHVISAHGGKIEVESEPGKGSIFRLLLKKI